MDAPLSPAPASTGSPVAPPTVGDAPVEPRAGESRVCAATGYPLAPIVNSNGEVTGYVHDLRGLGRAMERAADASDCFRRPSELISAYRDFVSAGADPGEAMMAAMMGSRAARRAA